MLAVPSGASRAPVVVSPRTAGQAHLAALGGKPEILSLTPRPADLLNALRRRWAWALMLGIICAGAAVGIGWLVIPANYTAAAMLRVATNRQVIMFDKSGKTDSLLDQRRAQATLIKMNFVLNAALREEGISELPYVRSREGDPVTWLRDKIGVSFPDNGEILQISMTGDDPEQIYKLVNAVTNAYMTEVVERDRDNFTRRKQILDKSYQRNVDEIERLERNYRQVADTLGAGDPNAARAREIKALDLVSDLRTQYHQLSGEISGIERRISLMTAQLEKYSQAAAAAEEGASADPAELKRVLGDQLVEAALAQDPGIQHVQAEISQLTASIIEEKLRARTPDSPSVLRLEERKTALEAALTARREELVPQVRKSIEEQIDRGLADRPMTIEEKARQEIESLTITKAVLETELESLKGALIQAADEAEQAGSWSAELESTKSKLDRLKKLTDRLGAELDEWDIELGAAPRIDLLEKASRPITSDIDKKVRLIGLIGVAAFLAAVVGVAGVDFLSRRINSPSEIAYGLGLTVMGDVPLVSGRVRTRPGASPGGGGTLAQAMLAESIDNLRTTVLHRASTEGVKVILVTSSMPKEGKTTVSTQLAASLARSGRRILLIDGDVRRPSCHGLFEVPRDPGVSELLRGEAALDDVVRPTRVAGLWMIPAGHIDADAVQALARGALEPALEVLRQDYDLVIVDTGPVLSDSNCLLFGRHCDGVILSVMRDVSRTPRVFEACERIQSVDLRLLGAVVNGVGASRYRSYYGYYYRPYGYDDHEENSRA